MVYQIIYELKTPEKDYSSLYTYLEKEMGESGIHVLRDCWWVANPRHSDDMQEMCKELRTYLGSSDIFYVSSLDDTALNGWLRFYFVEMVGRAKDRKR